MGLILVYVINILKVKFRLFWNKCNKFLDKFVLNFVWVFIINVCDNK